MTKAEVANLVSSKTGMSRKDSMEALEEVLECIKSAIKDGEKVSLVGFGTFYLRQKNARKGRNPRTGEPIDIPPKAIAAFKPGKRFSEMVAQS